jgi:hypothetical protein
MGFKGTKMESKAGNFPVRLKEKRRFGCYFKIIMN